MDFSAIPPDTLAQWYRYALLLKGRPESAESVLLAAFAELEPQLDELRSTKHQDMFLARRMRERCAAGSAADAAPAPTSLSEAVASMPEPMRSAIALFYLKIFPVAEIATVLGLEIEDLADQLAAGRARLREAGIGLGTDPAPVR